MPWAVALQVAHESTLETGAYHGSGWDQERWIRPIVRRNGPLGSHWRGWRINRGYLWLGNCVRPLPLLQHILFCHLLSGLPPSSSLPTNNAFLYASTVLQWLGDWSTILMCFCLSSITLLPSRSSSSAYSITFLSLSPVGASFWSFLAASSMCSSPSELKENCSW